MRRRPLAAVLILVAGFPGTANAEPIDELVARLSGASEIAAEAVADPSPEAMDRVIATVGLPAEVEIAGRRVVVPADRFLHRLGGETASDFRTALRRLRAVQSALVAAGEAVVPPEDDLRRTLREVETRLGATEPGVYERLRRLIATVLARVARTGVAALRGGPAWIVLVLALGLVTVALWRLRLRPVPQARARAAPATSAAEWRRRGEAARARGDLAEAVAALYRSTVASLAERGLVEDRPSLTAGEVRAAVSTEALRDATRRYERVRYGMVAASEEDLRALVEAERLARAA